MMNLKVVLNTTVQLAQAIQLEDTNRLGLKGADLKYQLLPMERKAAAVVLDKHCINQEVFA